MSPHLGEIFTISLPDGPTVEHLGIEWARNLPGANHGPVNASFADVKENPVGKSWIETFEQLGFPLTGNPFCGNSTGAYNGVSTIDGATKTKSSSSKAYYKSLTERTNVEFFLDTLAQTIVMEKAGGDPEAKGVHVIHNGSTSVIHAKKEVILASGVFNTPKLLELSGIGDPAILTKLGIDVNAANPNVGRNLQDHILCSISFEAEDGIPTGDELARGNATALQAAMDMYQKYHAGPLATSGITSFAYLPIFKLDQEPNAYGAILSDLATGSAEESPMDGARRAHLRDLIENGKEGTGQYFLFMAQADSAGKDTVGTFGSNPKPGNYISLAVALSHPLSTGTSHITSTDPNQPPTIDHRYLSHPVDLELHARQVRSLEVIAATEPFASLLKSKGRRNDPQSFIGGDLEKAKTYVRNMSTTNWHSCGTCAMGPRQKGGVVDESLRVHGVRGLRIVDASVIPFIPQSNLQSLVYTVAHKASDIIREDIT